MEHPRIRLNGTSRKIPLSEPTGKLGGKKDAEVNSFEELGIGVSLYFKILKRMTIFFFVASILSSPLAFIYSRGEVAENSSNSLAKIFSRWTLGNLGDDQVKCYQTDVTNFNSIQLWCPAGSKIDKITTFGLQAYSLKEGNYSCP